MTEFFLSIEYSDDEGFILKCYPQDDEAEDITVWIPSIKMTDEVVILTVRHFVESALKLFVGLKKVSNKRQVEYSATGNVVSYTYGRYSQQIFFDSEEDSAQVRQFLQDCLNAIILADI